ncbi:MAG: hypothetical protein AAGH99_13215 [Planctomycetota bacterium]
MSPPTATVATSQHDPPSTGVDIPIKRDITCPHCWDCFVTGDIRWIARHPELLGDAMLGPEAMRRFLPTRFDIDGNAIDAGGEVCRDLACPSCHLPISRGLLEANQYYFSLIGVPGSGKSHFTAAMTWRLRSLMPEAFGLTFTDLDVVANQVLLNNEQLLFLDQGDADRLVSIEKTQMQGSNYDPVHRGGQTVQLPRPFQFHLAPRPGTPRGPSEAATTRVINLYDNAGEHFLPGGDTTLNPGTQHLARANALMFLFDPLRDARFRAAIEPQCDDPQIKLDREAGAVRQDTVLNEACSRLRRYANLSPTAQLDQPLIVLMGKADAWINLIDGVELDEEPILPPGPDNTESSRLDIERIEDTSQRLRSWVEAIAPEFVALAEGLHKRVVFMPVSALGGAPIRDESNGLLLVRPGKLKPRWVSAPLLYALKKWSSTEFGAVSRPQDA